MPEAILDKTYRWAALGMARKLQNCGLPKFDPHLEGHSPKVCRGNAGTGR